MRGVPRVRLGSGRLLKEGSMAVKAITRNFGMSPKKVRRYLGLIRGKPVEEAVASLQFIPSPAAKAVIATVRSAAANAENNNLLTPDELKVVAAFADDGPRLRRFRPQSRGRVSIIRRRFCHITVLVDTKGVSNGT